MNNTSGKVSFFKLLYFFNTLYFNHISNNYCIIQIKECKKKIKYSILLFQYSKEYNLKVIF